jgi:hypothetical protein
MMMNDEQKAAILSESFATLKRLEQREQSARERSDFQIDNRGHFGPWRAAQKRRAAASEPFEAGVLIRHSEPIITKMASTDDGGWPAYIDARIAGAIAAEHEVIIQAVGEALGEALETSERAQSRALHAELGALKVEVAKLENLLEALRIATERDRSKIIDLPAWPTRRDIN